MDLRSRDEQTRRPTGRKRGVAIPTAIALVALFVSLGGTSLGEPAVHAAGKAARALRIAKHSEKLSRTALRVADRAQKTADAALAKTAVPGPAGSNGAAGAPGAPGKPGSALGYAKVEYCAAGGCEDQPSIGWFAPDGDALGVDNTANFSHPNVGVFCFQLLPFHTRNVVANLGPSSGNDTSNSRIVQTRVGTTDDPIGTADGCAPGGEADRNAVVYVRSAAGTLEDPDHSAKMLVLFN
jgi:hypothetical protein